MECTSRLLARGAAACAAPFQPRPLAKAPPKLMACRASASGAGITGGDGHGQRRHLASARVADCLERAAATGWLIGGQHFIPLSEAQRWFEAGMHEAASQGSEHLSEVAAENGRLQQEMRALAETALKDHNEHEQGMRRLLDYALALEGEVEHSHRASQEAALEAAHLAEERVLQQYRQALEELESAHEAEQEAIVGGLRGQVAHLEGALRASHEAKKQWRERALQAEGQFIQLRTLIQSSLEQASGAALRRQQLLRQQAAVVGGLAEKGAEEGEGEEQAAPLPHTDPHIRGSEDMVPADADVASQHPHATSAAPVEPVQGKRGGGMGRRVRGEAGPSLPGGEPHLA